MMPGHPELIRCPRRAQLQIRCPENRLFVVQGRDGLLEDSKLESGWLNPKWWRWWRRRRARIKPGKYNVSGSRSEDGRPPEITRRVCVDSWARSEPGKKNGKLLRSSTVTRTGKNKSGEVVPGKYKRLITAAAALASRLVCSGRHAKEGGKNLNG